MGKNSGVIDEAKLMSFLDAIAKDIALQAQDCLTNATVGAINNYYGWIHPKYYERTYNFADNSYLPYYSSEGTYHIGGVQIGDMMADEVYQIPAYQVIDLAIHGWHGHPCEELYQNPSPLDEIIKARDKFIKNREKYVSKAEVKYSYLLR